MTVSGPIMPPQVVVLEPPPPYTASIDPSTALGGPKRGHRKNKRQTSADAKPTTKPGKSAK